MRCKFYIDPNDSTTWNSTTGECHIDQDDYNDTVNKNPVWHCPRATVAGERYCPFHIDSSASHSFIVTAFLKSISGEMYAELPTEQRLCFIGSKFASFRISSGSLGIEDDVDIDLRHSVFEAEVDIDTVNVQNPIKFDGTQFHDEVCLDSLTTTEIGLSDCHFAGKVTSKFFRNDKSTDISNAVFEKDVDFSTSQFGSLNMMGTEFKSDANFIGITVDSISVLEFTVDGSAFFSHSSFDTIAMFSNCEFNDKVYFTKSDFHERADFKEVKFSGYAGFDGVKFHSEAEFTNAIFSDTGWFSGARFKGPVDFTSTQEEVPPKPIDGTMFQGPVVFSDAVFESEADFRTLVEEDGDHVPTNEIPTFGDIADFYDSNFHQGGVFTGLSYNTNNVEPIRFSRAEITNSSFNDAKLSACFFTDANMQDSNFQNSILYYTHLERSLMMRVNLFGADLTRARLYSAVLSDAKISEETEFGSHYVTDDDSLNDVCESDLQKSIWSLRLVERISDANALSEQSRRAYIQSKNHAKALAKKTDKKKYIRLAFSKWAWVYGEGLMRIGIWSVVVILISSLLFLLAGGAHVPPAGQSGLEVGPLNLKHLGKTVSYRDLFINLHISISSFTTIGSSLKPANDLVRAISDVESGIGNILLAALLFVLGRRISR